MRARPPPRRARPPTTSEPRCATTTTGTGRPGSATRWRTAPPTAPRWSSPTRRASRSPRRSPPAGSYGPAQFHTAYSLPTATPAGAPTQTIAIVDAYDDPNIESDLAAYDSQYGLPPCTTANGCFRKVNQSGGTSYPSGDGGWAPRDRARRRGRARDLPELQDPPRRGELGRRSPTSAPPRTRRSRSARPWSRTPTGGGEFAGESRLRLPTSTTPASRSPPRPATAATASSTRRPRRT